jgi:hypothetical protein
MKEGDEVVCIDAKPRNNGPTGLIEGQHYPLSAIWDCGECGFGCLVGELPLPTYCLGWHLDRFVPVRKTDISIFEAMLKVVESV